MLHAAAAVAILCTLWLGTARKNEVLRGPIIDIIPSGSYPDEGAPAMPEANPAIPPVQFPKPLRNAVPEPPRPIKTPVSSPPGQRMTIGQFRAIHGQPNPATGSPRQQHGKPIIPRQINASDFTNDARGITPVAPGERADAGIQAQMTAYFAHLAQCVREAQEQPDGLGSELVVRIEFQVFADGSIGAVKVIHSSGNRAFDDSVLKAIRSVRSIGSRPDGKSDAKVADFRMRELE